MNVLRCVQLLLAAGFVLLVTSGAQAQAPGPISPPPADMALLARWVTDQQFHDRVQRSYGAVKVAPGIAAIGADGTRYYRVSPYTANLGVLGLLDTQTPGRLQTARLWVTWYLSHLDPQSAPDGVPDEHFYQADGSGETTCVKPGDPHLCHYNDATDSAAATFFCVLWASWKAGIPKTFLNAPGRKQRIEKLAATLLNLQQSDGLCWAKSDYRAKYLEDNCEVYAGLRALTQLEQTAFGDQERAKFYAQAARRVQHGIVSELYDAKTKRYFVAKFEDSTRKEANLDVWYPDTQAQVWPHLFGVVAPSGPQAQAVIHALEARWSGKTKPDWAAHPEQVNGGWVNADVAHAILLGGNVRRVQTYLHSVRRLKFPHTPKASGFTWPFTVGDAGWLLATLTRMPKPPYSEHANLSRH